MIENQVTSIEQADRLILLGIPAEKASMAWTTVNGHKTVVERDLCLPENIEGYAFTVADLLDIIPLTIEEEGYICEFSLKKIDQAYGVVYECPYSFNVSFLFHNTAIDAIEYAVEWFAKYHSNDTRISNEQWITDYLKDKDYTSPTDIGRAHAAMFGIKSLNHHSSWASPICKRMVKKWLLIRNDKGHYKLINND